MLVVPFSGYEERMLKFFYKKLILEIIFFVYSFSFKNNLLLLCHVKEKSLHQNTITKAIPATEIQLCL